MSLSLNTNLSALIALNNIDQTGTELNTSIERLSTGLQINSGADNPSGLIISQGMQAEMQGMAQAIQNTQNATNMANTADGALSEVGNLLQTLNGLAVGAANSAVLNTAALQADQTQVQSILQSINNIATETEFDGKKLLDGSAGVTANVTAGADVSSIYMSGTFNGSTLESGPITATLVQPATEAAITLSNTFANGNAIVTGTGNIVINGYTIPSSGTESVQSLVASINAESDNTGVSASIAGNGPVQIVLTADGYGSQNDITYFDPNDILNNKPSATADGQNAVMDVSAMTSAGLQTVTFTGGATAGASGLQLSDTSGNSVLLTQTGNAAITTVPVAIGQVTSGSLQFQIGPNSGQSVEFGMPSVFAQDLGTGVVGTESLDDINLTTTTGANQAIQIVQQAVSQVATLRGQIGSFQDNILQASQNYLNTANQNLAASESSITDTNMASQMTTFTQQQILQQSGIAVLAQANNIPRNILTLLQNG